MLQTANDAWCALLYDIMYDGVQQSPRGIWCTELLAHRTVIDMNYPIVSVSARKMGYKFLFAEAAWICSGDSRVSTIRLYSKQIGNFSDNGFNFFGSYGPALYMQLGHIVSALDKDSQTRQAVATIWRPSPPESKDIPCTVALQWVIRGGKLHCIATMRSSDAWLGWVYDVFNFSAVSRLISFMLREPVELGNLYLTAGSQHLYESNRAAVEAPFGDRADEMLDGGAGDFTDRFGSRDFEHVTISRGDFINPGPDRFIAWLWEMANQDWSRAADYCSNHTIAAGIERHKRNELERNRSQKETKPGSGVIDVRGGTVYPIDVPTKTGRVRSD